MSGTSDLSGSEDFDAACNRGQVGLIATDSSDVNQSDDTRSGTRPPPKPWAQPEGRLIVRGDAAQAACKGASSRYHVVWAHAKGGLGEIFVAEDTELHRRVALKEIQPKHAQNAVSRERFVNEAEITGKLEHPGIVPVYGMGTYPDGRPYYTMRFVRGEDLATAVRRFHAQPNPNLTGLEFRWLLRRFLDVCNTIAYAHSRGVLHRDLKPGNIMLGQFGETLVLDWGVAKLIGQSEPAISPPTESDVDSTDPAIQPRPGSGSVTLTGQAVGTPAYMSPEQAAGRLNELGPASDVYSLGATLYVMLTDRRPFDGDAPNVLHQVQEGKFEPLSRLQPRVPKVLDVICSKAMALEPAARYQSALDLASDLERWLADEPVSCWREPRLDRARRWVRRHLPLVAAGSAALGMALVALGVAVPLLSMAWRNESLARRGERRERIAALQKAAEAEAERSIALAHLETANSERARAQSHEAVAQDQRDRAETTLQFLVNIFRRPDPAVDGRSLKAIDLLRRAAREVEGPLGGQPVVQSTLYTALGKTFSGLGMTDEAFDVFRRAAEIRRGQLGVDHPDTLKAMQNLAMAYQDQGRLDKAIPILEETLRKRTATLGPDHADTIESTNDLAVAFWEAGDPMRAIPLYEVTLEKTRATLGEDHEDTLTIADNLAVAYAAAGRPDRAIPLHQSVLARLRKKLGDDHPTALIAANNLARAYESAGRTGDAISLYEQTVPKLRAKLTDDHPVTLTALHGLARAYNSSGQVARAICVFDETLTRRRAKLGADHPDTLLTMLALAGAYRSAQEPGRALALAREFLDRAGKIQDRLPRSLREAMPGAAKLVENLTKSASG